MPAGWHPSARWHGLSLAAPGFDNFRQKDELDPVRFVPRRAAESGDDGTHDLLVSDVIRQNEQQVWFLAEHVVDVPLVRAT